MADWDEIQKFITDHPPSPIEETQNIHCAALFFSSLLLNAAKVSISFGRLGCPLQPGGARKWRWLQGKDGLDTPRPIASHMLRHNEEHSWSSPGPKSRPGRPPAITCRPRSNHRAVFNLHYTVASKKGTSCDPEFPNTQSPKDTHCSQVFLTN